MSGMDRIRKLGPLTEHFSWLEVFASDTADRLGIDNVPQDLLSHFMPRIILTSWFLEQIRNDLGGHSIAVSSWFRTAELNARIPGASASSNHLLGGAVDGRHRSGPIALVRSAKQRALALGWGYELIVYPTFAHIAPLPESANTRKCLRKEGDRLIPFEPATAVRS